MQVSPIYYININYICQWDKNRFWTLSQKEDGNVSEVVKIENDFFAENFTIAGLSEKTYLEKTDLDKEDLDWIIDQVEKKQAEIKDENHKWLFSFSKLRTINWAI